MEVIQIRPEPPTDPSTTRGDTTTLSQDEAGSEPTETKQDSPQGEKIESVKKDAESIEENEESPVNRVQMSESWVVVSNEPSGEGPPMRQAWGEGQAGEESMTPTPDAIQPSKEIDDVIQPPKESDVSSLHVHDIEEEVSSSIAVSEVPPPIQEVFSTPTAPVSWIVVLIVVCTLYVFFVNFPSHQSLSTRQRNHPKKKSCQQLNARLHPCSLHLYELACLTQTSACCTLAPFPI